jgi:hypothetical protein
MVDEDLITAIEFEQKHTRAALSSLTTETAHVHARHLAEERRLRAALASADRTLASMAPTGVAAHAGEAMTQRMEDLVSQVDMLRSRLDSQQQELAGAGLLEPPGPTTQRPSFAKHPTSPGPTSTTRPTGRSSSPSSRMQTSWLTCAPARTFRIRSERASTSASWRSRGSRRSPWAGSCSTRAPR